MIRRLLVVAVLAAITAACASSPQARLETADPREKDPAFRYSSTNPGKSPVGAIPDVTVTDPQRSRDYRITIEYPTRGGPHPLIVISHATGLSNRSYPGLTSHWASYGYVVIRVSHGDNDVKIDDMTPTLWRDRARDITFVLDSLTSLTQRFPELEGKIDPAQVAVAGHARGAMTALMLGGLRLFPGGTSYADPRVKAVVAMSPFGPQPAWGVTEESFATVNVPALFMTGDRDKGVTETETPEWRARAFELAAAGDKWLVTLENVGSNTFTGLAGNALRETQDTPEMDATRVRGGATPADVEQRRIERNRMQGFGQRALFGQSRAMALAFLDNYLKGDAGGRTYLTEQDGRSHIVVKNR